MERRQLGDTGMEIAPIVFGGNVLGWTTDEARSFRVLDAFVDHGFDAIDTADIYSIWADGHRGGESEEMLGRWLAARPGMRDRVRIFTKVGSDMGGEGRKGLGADWIPRALDGSLSRMGIEAVDLYFSHWPDPGTDHAETLGAYKAAIEAGKVGAIGASNYDAGLLGAAQAAARAEGLPRYQVLQPEYNLVDRDGFEGATRDFCLAEGLGVVPYFSLAAGFLTGKYRSEADLAGRARAFMVGKYLTDRNMRILDALEEVAASRGATPAETALAWLIGRTGVTAPIASATSVAQVESFARAAEMALTDEEMRRLTDAG